ncbi:Eco57I restriction-modification methylase domain-containing protein [Chloroflexus sp.]|uniref:Eco57I restriction-modification methylase domain-containing protein n=1 Tax=Chloroflexus sp. TaxID=1904827 RepID=UPI002ADE5CF5|nr:N-6 DNA methylase [Chloroflexus sp.]
MKTSPAIRIEGGLFSPDVFEALTAGDLPGQQAADFGLPARRSLTDEIAAAFNDARTLWGVFQNRLARLPDADLATSLTRDAWVIPFLGLLGYELRYNPRAFIVDGMSFAISHRAGEPESAPPVHIVGARQELGRLAPSGRTRLSPHALVQEYLNRSEHLWGLTTNGIILRLLRDSTFVRRQAYVEFDLCAILEEDGFADFVLLYRLLHRSRLPQDDAPQECLLERYYQHALEQGGRVREHLRDGVEVCIKTLANGFFQHPANGSLRQQFGEGNLTSEAFYRDLLRLVYRFLFLLVAEERGLMGDDPLYLAHYGVTRLRRLAEQRAAYSDDKDLWHSLCALWLTLADETLAAFLRLPPLNGELFSPLVLNSAVITNRDLLQAFWHLAFYQESSSQPPRRVNYAALDTEELGSVYESLLDYSPVVTVDAAGRPMFDLIHGSERKSTGSYYTPPELVSELVASALEPVLQARLRAAGTPEEQARALLSLRVLDPAAGSGHFLLAAARRLGKELARIRTGEDEPAPEQVRTATREVVAHCIYGVDKNPLAVELCRVALWLESHAEGKPLTFLDHRIKCGDSLVGVLDLHALEDGVPDAAFDPVSGDDKRRAADLKRHNRREREGQMALFEWNPNAALTPLSAVSRQIEALPDDSPEHVRCKRQLYETRFADPHWRRQKEACDLWSAAFFQDLSAAPIPITTDVVRRHLAGQPALPQTLAQAVALAEENRFFHWPLEFPEVLAAGGFDVVLGNPPWERIKLQEQEFFAARDPDIAEAPNAAARKRLIEQLPHRNPELWQAYCRALYTAKSASRFLRGSGQYPLTGRGDINTYSVFAERACALLRSGGCAGILLPTGIATDATNQFFFADLVEKGHLVSLFDFENREGLFPAVDSRMKFCLLTLERSPLASHEAPAGERLQPAAVRCYQFAFFRTRAEHLHDVRRRFSLSAEEIARINPNTRTLPVFRTRQDADLTRAIYERVPVLVNERTGENPWGVRFLAMFHMSNDSHLFRTRAELEQAGYRLMGNVFVAPTLEDPLTGAGGPGMRALPLYEAKMIWHYDHRFGSYAGVDVRASTQLPTPTDAAHADPGFLAQPWYWVPEAEVEARLGDWPHRWLLGFRNVTNATNERTAIFSLFPKVGVGHSLPILLFGDIAAYFLAGLVANLQSLAFDWVVRQKQAGVNMNFFYVEQFPVLPPSAYTAADLRFIVPRVLELTYTAWDLKPFADDVWHEADDALRTRLRTQWGSHAQQAGGQAWEPPDWKAADPAICTDPQTGCPLPPFRWDAVRRAVVCAELDAYYARRYGLTRKQLRYILDPADLTARELEDILDPWEAVSDPLDPVGYADRVADSDFPGETFRVLKKKELRQHGEYRTRRLVLEAWEAQSRKTGNAYDL